MPVVAATWLPMACAQPVSNMLRSLETFSRPFLGQPSIAWKRLDQNRPPILSFAACESDCQAMKGHAEGLSWVEIYLEATFLQIPGEDSADCCSQHAAQSNFRDP